MQRDLLDRPIKISGLDCLGRRGGVIQLCTEPVPGLLPHVHHGCAAVFNLQLQPTDTRSRKSEFPGEISAMPVQPRRECDCGFRARLNVRWESSLLGAEPE